METFLHRLTTSCQQHLNLEKMVKCQVRLINRLDGEIFFTFSLFVTTLHVLNCLIQVKTHSLRQSSVKSMGQLSNSNLAQRTQSTWLQGSVSPWHTDRK